MPVKINKTAYIILLCLQFICRQKVFTVRDISDYLEKYDFFIADETVLKYIRTMKVAGFGFTKINSKTYKLIYIPFEKSDMTANTILHIFGLVSKYTLDVNDKKELINKLYPLLSYNKKLKLDKIIEQNEKRIQTNKQLKKLQKYCDDRTKISIKLNDMSQYSFEPQNLLMEHGNIYLYGVDAVSRFERKININKISDIRQTPQINRLLAQKKYAELKISLKFKNRYVLKNDEKILKETSDFIIIRTSYTDKITFFKNLLRYTENCEILSPTGLRQEFTEFINQIYQMYD